MRKEVCISDTITMNNRVNEGIVDLTLSDVKWERTICYFYISVKKGKSEITEKLEYYLVSKIFLSNAKPSVKKINEECFQLTLVITNPGYVRCLSTGSYSLYACLGRDVLCRVRIDESYMKSINDASKIFVHGDTGAYIVDFSIAEENVGIFPMMRVMDTSRKDIFTFTRRDAPKTFLEKTMIKCKKKVKKILRRGIQFSYDNWAALHCRNRRRKKTVLFLSEQNEILTENLKAVNERMIERGLDKIFNISISLRSVVDKKKEYGIYSWYSTIKKIANADVIFVDDHCPILDRLKLCNSVELIQLWHAGAGYKGVGYCRWGHKFSPSPFSCHRQYKYCISPSKEFGHYFAEQFGINEEQIITTGMPRIDKYLDKEYRNSKTKELFEKYSICKGKKVILFAPTYRGKDKSEAYYPYDMIDFDALYELCGDRYVVLFKMHPWVKDPVPIKKDHKDRFLDVNSYPNINDLYYITDLYISDYSSGIFEYSLMRKPAVFYAFDELQYSYSRGFHRDYRSSTPGKICSSFREVLSAIENRDFEFYKIESYIKEHFDFLDDGSTDRVIDWFLLDKMPKEYLQSIDKKNKDMDVLRRLDFAELDM